MKIHEYQARQLLSDFGIPVPKGKVCQDPSEVRLGFEELGVPLVVVKAQVFFRRAW